MHASSCERDRSSCENSLFTKLYLFVTVSVCILMSLVCTRILLVCYSYVTRMLLVCYSYVTRMLLVCYSYVSRMLLVCTRMLLVCTRMYPYVTRMYSCGVLVTIDYAWYIQLDVWYVTTHIFSSEVILCNRHF